MLLVRVGSISFGSIVTFWARKVSIKTQKPVWILGQKSIYKNSKTCVNFVDFSCVIFLTQNVPIPPNHSLLFWFTQYNLKQKQRLLFLLSVLLLFLLLLFIVLLLLLLFILLLLLLFILLLLSLLLLLLICS